MISVLFLAVAASAVSAAPVASGKYPRIDVVPQGNADWTAKFMTNVPDIAPKDPTIDRNADFSLTKTKCVGNKVFGLTFDDGPSTPTPQLLDELKKRKIKATFFVVGSRVIGSPQTLKRAFSEGHEIAMHTWSHPNMMSLTNDQIVAEIVWNAKAIRDVIGVTPRYIRPPYGECDERVAKIAQNMGLTIVNWAVDSTDSWGVAGPKDVKGAFAEYIRKNPDESPIALEHDLYDYQAAAAPAAIDMLTGAGYAVVPVGVCLGEAASYSDKIWSVLDGSADAPADAAPTEAAPAPQPTRAPSKGPQPPIPANIDPAPSASATTEPPQTTTVAAPKATVAAPKATAAAQKPPAAALAPTNVSAEKDSSADKKDPSAASSIYPFMSSAVLASIILLSL